MIRMLSLILLFPTMALAGPSVSPKQLEAVPVEALGALDTTKLTAIDQEIAAAEAGVAAAVAGRRSSVEAVGDAKETTRDAKSARAETRASGKATLKDSWTAVEMSKVAYRAKKSELKAARRGVKEARASYKARKSEVKTEAAEADAVVADAKRSQQIERSTVTEARAGVEVAELELALLKAKRAEIVATTEHEKAMLVASSGGAIDVASFVAARDKNSERVAAAQARLDAARAQASQADPL